ncbi:MAG: EAL domain-containing protein [Magnetococcales bacterium]|nr:EAL domain-containing protein [Magnetococcales bacterium]
MPTVSSSGPLSDIPAGLDFKHLAESLPNALWVVQGNVILYANPAAALLNGLNGPEEMTDAPWSTFVHPEFQQPLRLALQSVLKHERNSPPTELRLLRPDEMVVHGEALFSLAMYQDQPVVIVVIRDISHQKRVEERIRHQANYDSLTGLPNRALFLDRLSHELVRTRRQKSHLALMFIDLDRFKWVNDTLGHAAGDALLREASNRLQDCVRKSDTVARLGGDEFTIILPDMSKGPQAERVTRKILDSLAEPFLLEGQEAFISGSIGITIYPDDADEQQDLLKNADSAMYRAKGDGRNTYRFYTPDMHAEAMERMAIEKDLHRALERKEMILHFQPILDVHSLELVGAESFLRWNHPERGNVPPDVFIAIAEEIGLTPAINEWVLNQACLHAKRWREKGMGENFFITVNLSCTRCRDLLTKENLQRILTGQGLPASGLGLEITENIVLEEETRSIQRLNQIKELGVRLWLDDFGTGYSSLSLLKRLPIDGVKVDRTFIPYVTRDMETAVLVEAIMSLARSLNREVIAEGVESEEQLEFLIEHGCQMAQGYHFAKPMPEKEFEAWWANQRT